MSDNKKHKLNTADYITMLRILGTIILLAFKPLSAEFFCVYTVTGITDIMDGFVARKTKTASDFGARLDSVADLLFYAVMLLKIFPILWNTLPANIWYSVGAIIIVRIAVYLIAALKFHKFASLHTYLNKLTGAAVFFIPFLLLGEYAAAYCRIVCAIAALAAFEELLIHLGDKDCRSDRKSIFRKEKP